MRYNESQLWKFWSFYVWTINVVGVHPKCVDESEKFNTNLSAVLSYSEANLVVRQKKIDV